MNQANLTVKNGKAAENNRCDLHTVSYNERFYQNELGDLIRT